MFGKVNPGRTEAALEGFNRKQDAVDKLFESPNHQIFLSAILYIFQIILSPSLMISILIETKLGKSLQGNAWCSWRAIGEVQTSRSLFRIAINYSKYISTMFGKVNPSRTEAALKGFNKKLDAVDELFEASNH